MQRGECHMNFIVISELSISNVCLCYILWSWVESAKAMPRKRFLAIARAEMKSSMGLKCWLRRAVLQENTQGKLLCYFPSRTSVLLEKNILMYLNCEQTSKLRVHGKKSIEFEIIYWEIITFEVTGGSVIFIFFFFQMESRNRHNCKVSCFYFCWKIWN